MNRQKYAYIKYFEINLIYIFTKYLLKNLVWVQINIKRYPTPHSCIFLSEFGQKLWAELFVQNSDFNKKK